MPEMTKQAVEASLSRMDTWRDIFTFLVVVGVAGEFLIGFLYSRRTKDLQAIHQSEQDALSRDVAQAHAAAAQANAAAAQSNATAESERLARLQLEVRLAPRLIAPGQSSQISPALATFGRFNLDIYLLNPDGETSAFLQSVLPVFSDAGWTFRVLSFSGASATATGFLVSTRIGSSPEIEMAADGIVTQMRLAGINCRRFDSYDAPLAISGMMSGDLPTPANMAPLRIIVGTKP